MNATWLSLLLSGIGAATPLHPPDGRSAVMGDPVMRGRASPWLPSDYGVRYVGRLVCRQSDQRASGLMARLRLPAAHHLSCDRGRPRGSAVWPRERRPGRAGLGGDHRRVVRGAGRAGTSGSACGRLRGGGRGHLDGGCGVDEICEGLVELGQRLGGVVDDCGQVLHEDVGPSVVSSWFMASGSWRRGGPRRVTIHLVL